MMKSDFETVSPTFKLKTETSGCPIVVARLSAHFSSLSPSYNDNSKMSFYLIQIIFEFIWNAVWSNRKINSPVEELGSGRSRNQAAVDLLESWNYEQPDANQERLFELLKKTVDEQRIKGRKRFE